MDTEAGIRRGRRTNAELIEDGQMPRERGEGSIYRVKTAYGERWQASKTLYMAGKNAVRATGTGKTKADALKALDRNWKKRLVLSGELPVSVLGETPKASKLTFREVAWEWHEWKKTTKLSSQVITIQVAKQYERMLNNHILPVLGDKPIRLITPDEIERFIFVQLLQRKKRKRDPKTGLLVETGEPLVGQSHQRTIQGVVSMITAYAKKKRYISIDPSHGIDRVAKPNNKRTGLEDRRHEVLRFVEEIHGTEAEGTWVLALYGLRKSERLGLTWDCFKDLNNPEKARVEIKQQLKRHPDTGKLYIAESLKTESSARIIPLDDRVREAMLRHKVRQEKMKQSPSWEQPKEYEGLVYTTSRGTPISHSKDNEAWKRVWASISDEKDPKTGKPIPAFKPLQQHALRHMAVSLLISEGVAIEFVRSIVGHHSVEITRSVYTHLSANDKKAPMRVLTNKLWERIDGSKDDENLAVRIAENLKVLEEQRVIRVVD